MKVKTADIKAYQHQYWLREKARRREIRNQHLSDPNDPIHLRSCKRCHNKFRLSELARFTFKGAYPKYICHPCKALIQNEIESKLTKEAEKAARIAKSNADKTAREQAKRTKELVRAEKIAYQNSPAYIELKREKKRQRNRQYRANRYYKDLERSRQIAKEKRKKYYERHPDKKNDHHQRGKRARRAQKNGAGGNFTKQDWQSLLDITCHKCLKCGASDCRLAPDHIVPIGVGSNTITNIQPYCWSCNSKKGRRFIEDNRTIEQKDAVYRMAFPNLISIMESESDHSDFFLPILSAIAMKNLDFSI